MSASLVLSVSLHLSPFMCFPEWRCPPLRSCLCLVSLHLSPFICVRLSGLVCALFPFICLPSAPCLLSFVLVHLSPFCNIAYDRAVRKVSLRNMMSEKLPIHTPFPRSSLQFFKPDVLAVVLAGCAGSPNKDALYMFHNTFTSVEIRIFIPEELTGYLQQLTPHFASTLSFVDIFTLTPRADQKYAGGAVIRIVLLIASLRTFSVAGVLF